MAFSRQFAPAVATLVSLGFLAIDYLFHHSHASLLFLYLWMLWMALYFLFAMVIMMCARLAFEEAMARWSSQSAARSKPEVIGDWIVSALVICLAVWHEHMFLWAAFVLALAALIYIQFDERRYTPRSQ
jgi:protein-S-isoprenylcysteine O-methyltransferase Ste14